MSRASRPVILSANEERTLRTAAQTDALESLRVNHPELFSRISPEDPDVLGMKRVYHVDVTKDDLLEILLRPYVKRIHQSLGPDGRPQPPGSFMFHIVRDALNMLDIDTDDLAKIGIVFRCNHECTGMTFIHGYINYLREALFNLHKLKTRAQKAAASQANVERDRRMAESVVASRARAAEIAAARREEIRRNREYERILEAEKHAARNAKLREHGKIPVPEADLLGIRSAQANSKELLNMTAARRANIEKDLAGLFGGAKRTRKHKHRKTRKTRKYSRK